MLVAYCLIRKEATTINASWLNCPQRTAFFQKHWNTTSLCRRTSAQAGETLLAKAFRHTISHHESCSADVLDAFIKTRTLLDCSLACAPRCQRLPCCRSAQSWRCRTTWAACRCCSHTSCEGGPQTTRARCCAAHRKEAKPCKLCECCDSFALTTAICHTIKYQVSKYYHEMHTDALRFSITSPDFPTVHLLHTSTSVPPTTIQAAQEHYSYVVTSVAGKPKKRTLQPHNHSKAALRITLCQHAA